MNPDRSQDLELLCAAHVESVAQIIERLAHDGDGALHLDALPPELARLTGALGVFAKAAEQRRKLSETLFRITTAISAGHTLEQMLDYVYEHLSAVMPYDRIGFSLLSDDKSVVTAHWSRCNYDVVHLETGYAAVIKGSSLSQILQTGEPRILNDLPAYLEARPHSESTRRIVEEGIRSSLTCPLLIDGRPIGFIFFSSRRVGAYAGEHINIFKQIAAQLAVLVERGRLASEIARQNEALRRADAHKNLFLGNAAHDLRSPIATIQMVTKLLRAEHATLDGEVRLSFLDDIEAHAGRCKQLLDELLDISAIEAGHISIKQEPVSWRRFIEETATRHRRLAMPKGTNVVLANAPDAMVLIDPLRISQVLDNLISNAVKFSPPGSVVTVRTTLHPHCFRVAVSDEGPGIKPEDRERLFKDFEKLSATPTGGESSTGLGLAIAKRIVLAHEGSIGVDSAEGQGATFWFCLPPTTAADAPERRRAAGVYAWAQGAA